MAPPLTVKSFTPFLQERGFKIKSSQAQSGAAGLREKSELHLTPLDPVGLPLDPPVIALGDTPSFKK